MTNSIGDYLRAVREAIPLTQEDLGERIGTDQNYVSHVETGRIKKPSRKRLAAFARALDIPLSDLLRMTGLEVTIAEDAVVIPVRGVIPADALRWTSGEGASLDAVRLLPEDVAGVRDPERLFGLEVSGDCMQKLGIWSGDVVIVEPADGRTPNDGQLVVVEVNQEVSLKRWHAAGQTIQLLDGNGTVIHTLSSRDEVIVHAFYVTWKPITPRQ